MATISTDQFYPSVSLSATDAQGNAAPLFGVPVWASSDETVLTVQASADGMSAAIQTVAPGGPARVSVSAEGDPTAGVDTITGVTEDITVTLGPSHEAKTLVLALGTPADKVVTPPAPPPAPPAGP
jgi:hypothetical protein